MINYFLIPGINTSNSINALSVFEQVERFTGVSEKELMSKSRMRYIVDARVLFTKVMKTRTVYTLQKVGGYINRDHSAVIHYLKQFEALSKTDKEFYFTYLKILNNL